jgi:hypothetical protein
MCSAIWYQLKLRFAVSFEIKDFYSYSNVEVGDSNRFAGPNRKPTSFDSESVNDGTVQLQTGTDK